MLKRVTVLGLSLRSRKSVKPKCEIPPEILELIFQLMLNAEESCLATRTLIAASLVSRRWRAIAQVMLSYSVDTGSTSKMISFNHSTHIDRTRVRSVAFLMATPDPTYWTALLDIHPNLSGITIILHEGYVTPTQTSALNKLKDHPSITNITLLNFTLRWSSLILQYLPKGLRFLSLPEDCWIHPSHLSTPGISLYGLTLNRYPSELANWLLIESKSSLQFLTVVHMADLGQLGRLHPNLRSLRIIGSLQPPDSVVQLSQFLGLERLEITDMAGGTNSLGFLPPSLLYIRFSGMEAASALVDFLSNTQTETLPAPQTVVWDYFVSQTQDQSLNVLKEALRLACVARKINIRVNMREAPSWRSNDEDHEYDATLHHSCFGDMNTSVQLPAPVVFPARTVLALENARQYLPPRYTGDTQPTAERFRSTGRIWTICFRGYCEWVDEGYQREKAAKLSRAIAERDEVSRAAAAMDKRYRRQIIKGRIFKILIVVTVILVIATAFAVPITLCSLRGCHSGGSYNSTGQNTDGDIGDDDIGDDIPDNDFGDDFPHNDGGEGLPRP